MKLKPNLSFSEGSSPRVVLQAWNIACAARNSRKIYSNTPQTDLLSRKIKGNHVWTEPEEQIEWNRRNSVIRSSLHLSGASVLFGVSREANSSKRHARLLAMPRCSVCISQDGQKENHRRREIASHVRLSVKSIFYYELNLNIGCWRKFCL